MDLAGKAAVITGASSGIGQATAEILYESGMSILATARRRNRLESLAEQLPGIEYLEGDISDSLMPGRLISRATELFGRCDVVVNNAGIMTAGTIEEIDLDQVCRMVRINIEAAFRMAYTALRHFKKSGSGHLVNISSVLGTKTRPGAGAYAGTKYALEALTEALRLELAGSQIQVSSVQPGLVLTELHDDWPVHPAQTFNIKKPLRPKDIARAILFVLQQESHIRVPRMLIVPEESPL